MREINFFGEPLAEKAATYHFCFIGATGSGKTVCIRLLMQSVLYGTRETPVLSRALVYDAKGDTLPVLHGIVGGDDYKRQEQHKVVTLNPFDKRSYAWDIAADIKTLGHALQMASILIPAEEKASQPFFANAARHLLFGVLTVFIRAKVRWSLRDVMCAMMDAKRLCAVLESDTLTKRLVDLYFSHVETSQNIMSEIASRLGAFEIIASLWDKAEKAGRTISLDTWLNGTQKRILVLGSDPTNRFALDAINQVIFKRISELVIAQPEDKKRRTWFFLDEFVRAGKLEGMVDLATVGRSKGACIVLGFQDINGARAVYGKEVAEEILGQCTSLAMLRLQSPETAEWASRLFGQYEQPEYRKGDSTSFGKDVSFGRDSKEEIVKRELYLSSQFMYMPMTSPENGLCGYRYSPFFKDDNAPAQGRRGASGVKEYPISGKQIFGILQPTGERKGGQLAKKFTVAKDVEETGIDYRDAEEQYLNDWTPEDYKRLKLVSVHRQDAIARQREEKREIEKRIRELAELCFIKGYPTAARAKAASKLSPSEQTALFRLLDEFGKKELFLGVYPPDEARQEIENEAAEVQRIFRRIVATLHGNDLLSTPESKKDLASLMQGEGRKLR